ncbi:MAG TPA: tetratricopeptide repeat protein, partial [Blastocatellia bacterium]|nr:tetratricopeptide repeat protein [Blastocatellia bacterium]
HVSTQSAAASGGLLARVSAWVQRQLGISATGARDESSAGSTGETTISSWRTRDKTAIAILPFKNLAGSPETDFYSFSLADSVITELAQLRDLIVRPSSYIAQYQNKDVDPRTVGTSLAVDAVLIGGYLKSGDRFRVTPQLVEVNSGEIIWSDKIDVDARDIITVQDTISRQIVAGLRVKTGSGEQERSTGKLTKSPEGYEAYLKGRTLLYKFITQTLEVADLDSSVEAFTLAIQSDSEFALAHSGLGLCHLNYVLKGIGGKEHYRLAKQSFDRALAIDPRLIEPRVKLVYIDLFEGDSVLARREIRQLLKRAPNEASVHSTAAYVYRLSGQYDRALQAWEDYIRVSPTDVVFASYNRARIYNYQMQYDRAEQELRKGLAFEPNHPLLHAYGTLIEYRRGDLEKAISHMETVLAKHPELYSYRLFLAYGYHARGERDRAFQLVDEKLKGIAQADQDVAYWLASLYALDGMSEEAFEWLERAIGMGNENYPWFAIDPNWNRLRDSVRYQHILSQLKTSWESLADS